jgi:hypothetical protein
MKKLIFTFAVGIFALSLVACSFEQLDKEVQSVAPSAKASRAEEAFPNQRGEVKTAYFFGQKIQYQQIGGEAVFDSDMLLLPQDLEEGSGIKTQGTGRSKASSRWPNKTVYYVIDPSLPNPSRVMDAIAHWEANTNIQFVPRTTQRGYVLFRTGSGCSANVGYSGGLQYVNLASGCSTGNTIHEIGHTLGLWHEHTRVDRDTYVTINMGNVLSGYESNFYTYTQQNMDGFDYQGGLDFNSVMLYGSYDFSANGLPTITRKDGSTFTGQRNGLSETDISIINSMYP